MAKIPNPPKNLKLENFRATINKYGPAKASRFVVTITPPITMRNTNGLSMVQDMTYLCEQTELPGRGFLNMDFRYYGPQFKAPFQTQYEDITLIFMCRTEMKERQFFDEWMNIINPINTFDFSYRSNYVTTINIYQMSDIPEQGEAKAMYKFTLDEAWPLMIASQPVTWADDSYHRLSVTFNYKRWFRSEDEIKTKSYVLIDPDSWMKGPTVQESGGTFISRTYLPY